MRLICGIVYLDGRAADECTLTRMANALLSPGLDATISRRTAGSAAFAVLDFAAGARPEGIPESLPEGNDGTWVAADIRLDRPRELAESLDLSPLARHECLALAALARWGETLPDRMHGDFALAAWDPRRQRVVCARDIMGVRPLCYTHRPGRMFAFASLPRGLHASGVASPALDVVTLARMWVGRNGSAHETGFADIAWLPAGHSLVVSPEGLRVQRGWQPDPHDVGSFRGTRSDSAATLRDLIEQAVACRLPETRTAAAHLSGGLDSSSVAVIAARQLRASGRVLHGYSLLARPEPGIAIHDERPYVEAVLSQEPDIVWSPVHLPPIDGDGILEPDMPIAGPGAAPDMQICAAARSAGIDMVLSGAGGDETATYNGIGIYASMFRAGKWRRLPSELRARAKLDGVPFARTVAGRVVLPLLPAPLADMRQVFSNRSAPGNGGHVRRNVLRFLNPALAGQIGAPSPAAGTPNSAAARIAPFTGGYLVGRADRWSILGARQRVALSYPLLDRRIIDFTLSLPVDHFVDSGYSRQPFRNAMAGILPEPIRWRTTKFAPFPDMPRNLVRATPALLRRVEKLRGNDAASGILNFYAVTGALQAASQLATGDVAGLPPVGQGDFPRWYRLATHALRALTLAEYVVRMESAPAVHDVASAAS